MKKLLVLLIAIAFSAALISCSGSAMTDVSGTWKKSGYNGQRFQNLLIIAVSNDLVKRSSMENALSSEFKKNKIKASSSSSVLSPDMMELNSSGKIDTAKRNAIKSKIESMGFDGVVVVSLLDKKDRQQYVPGYTYYAPNHYYLSPGYGFYGYWYPTYEVVQSQGYYVNQTDIFLETTLFDLKTEELLWSAETETVNPSNIKSLASSYSYSVVNKMVDDRVVLK